MDAILEFLNQLPIAKIIMTAVLIILSVVIIKVILAILDRSLNRSKLDELTRRVLRTIVKGFLWCIAVIIVLSSLGIFSSLGFSSRPGRPGLGRGQGPRGLGVCNSTSLLC